MGAWRGVMGVKEWVGRGGGHLTDKSEAGGTYEEGVSCELDISVEVDRDDHLARDCDDVRELFWLLADEGAALRWDMTFTLSRALRWLRFRLLRSVGPAIDRGRLGRLRKLDLEDEEEELWDAAEEGEGGGLEI